MKKIFFNLLWISLSMIVFVSCEDDEDRYPYTPAAGLHISSTDVYELDEIVQFNFSATNLECKELSCAIEDVTKTVVLTQRTPENGDPMMVGELELTLNEIGIHSINDEATLKATAKIEKNPIYNHRIVMKSSLNVVMPNITTTENESTMYWEVLTSETINDISIFTKIGSLSDYELIGNNVNPVDSIKFDGTSYNINDTVFIKLKAETDNKTAVFEDYITIIE